MRIVVAKECFGELEADTHSSKIGLGGLPYWHKKNVIGVFSDCQPGIRKIARNS